MTIDTSAMLAILFDERERDRFNGLIAGAKRKLMSTASVLESYMTLETRRGDGGIASLDLFVLQARIEVVPFSTEQLNVARLAFRRYGKGRHRAGLNFGDCMSYGLSMVSGEPLLYKGDDFGYTDVRSALG